VNRRWRFPSFISVFLPCLILILLTGQDSGAQEYRGRVQGVVTDASKAPVPGATVTLKNVHAGIQTVRETDTRGHYMFDLVEPGLYTLTVELQGFSRFEQRNILVENRGDITVNAALQIGTIEETVVVSDSPAAVKFNTTTLELTADNTMVKSLPIVARNPFTLALLNPAVVSRYTSEKNPYFMWSPSTVEVGGSQNRTGEVLLDGMPIMLGPKSSYAPTMDNTTEVTVQQNSVDAEYGHSSGGILNVSMKSGTNEVHGTAYYFGRNPRLNAASDPMTHAANLVRNHMYGGAVGHPIIKSRIFNFFAFEQWINKQPLNDLRRMMTDRERDGDFSQTFNSSGGLRTIYDPWSSKFDSKGKAIRDPFPSNVIPKTRMDPSALKFLSEIWKSNQPARDITGRDNFGAAYSRNLDYYNISNRTDFTITDSLRTFFRFSRFRTTLEDPNYTPNKSRLFQNPNGGAMNALNVSGDVVWTAGPNTVVNVRANYISNNDDYDAPEQYATLDNYRQFFSDATDFYSRYLDIGAPFYYPELQIDEGGNYGKGNWWFQHPQAYYLSGKVSRRAGKHYLKAGVEYRTLRVDAIRPETFRFRFRANETANTFVSPDTKLTGDPWASYLLGAMSPADSYGRYVPFKKDTVNFWGLFVQDDFKLSRNVTLNVGLRFEYEGAIFDRGGDYGDSTFEKYRYSRGLDIINPIPEFQGADVPKMPAEALALMDRPYRWSGAWMFTDDANPGMWDPRKLILLPRAGAAIGLNNRTSLRIGWARFNTPSKLQRDNDVLGSTPVPGFGASSTPAPQVNGVPQQRLSDPFPAASNPVVMPVGKGDGRYTLMGGDAVWDKIDLVTAVNDRFNFTVQRETVARIVVEATYFFNLSRDRPYILDLNQVNPQIINQQGAALSKAVANPFYMLLPESKMRGSLRNQKTIALRELLKPFPHYNQVRQLNTDGMCEQYHSLQLRVQRPFASGFNFLVGYNYNQERWEEFFNKEETFLNQFRYTDSYRPRHRMNIAGTYEFPFGHGRRFMSQLPPFLDAIVGGWTASAIYWYNAGNRLHFDQMEVVGEPKLDNPDKWGLMFDPKAFKFIADAGFRVRTNPRTYPGVQGPGYKDIDATLSKIFRVTERYRVEFKMEAYNLTNTFSGADPSLTVTAASFGQVTRMAAGTKGRELQYNIRIYF